MLFSTVLRTCSGVTQAGLLNCRHPPCPHRHLTGRPPLSLLPRFLFFAPPPDPPLRPSGVTWTPSCTCLAAGCSMQLWSVESLLTLVSLIPCACCFCEADERPHEQLFPSRCDVRQVGGRTSRGLWDALQDLHPEEDSGGHPDRLPVQVYTVSCPGLPGHVLLISLSFH